MKVLKLDTPFIIEAVVRQWPLDGDVVVFKAIDEFSQISTEFTVEWTLEHGRLTFELIGPNEFKAGDKFEISIKNTTIDKIIYLGKMIVVNEDTDIQNYTPSKQQTQRFK